MPICGTPKASGIRKKVSALTDRTTVLENAVNAERKHRFRYVLGMWATIFKATKFVSIVYLALTLTLALSRPAIAFIWQHYIDGVQAKITNPALSLLPSVLLLITYFIVNFLAGLISRYTNAQEDIERLDLVQANRMQELMLTQMYAKLSRVSPEYFEVAKMNDTISQVFSFAGDRYNGASLYIMRSLFQVISKLVSIVSIAAALYIFNPWLCLLMLIAPMTTIWTNVVTNKLSFKFTKDNTKLQRRANYFQNLMLSSSAKEIKALGLYDFFYDKWKDAADEYTKNERKMIRTRSLIGVADSLFATLINLSGSIFAIVLMALGKISLGALGAALSLTQTLSSDMRAFTNGLGALIGKRHEASQFTDMMELPEDAAATLSPEAPQTKASEAASPESGCVTCENLRYRYPLTDKYVLDGVTLTIKKGEKVALVGENGAGKSTFVKLLTGMLTPSDGTLCVRSPGGWSAVMQEPVKYTTFTVGDNVFLGNVSAERDETAIDEALRFSGFGDADKNALLGKDTGGTELSGGQWQKLAIARAVYRNRDMIVLDEPTGNLDPLAEAEIFRKYIELSADKTVLFVTHRISAAALASRIIVFGGGHILEDGTPEELLGSGGEYARLHRAQAQWYE